MIKVSCRKQANYTYLKQRNIQINAGRLYLQVATLSDIFNPDRRTLNHYCLEGNKPIHPSSTVRWPNQPLPSPQVWNLWNKTVNISDNNTLPIHQQLREWIVPYSLRQMYYRWNYSREKDEIFELNQNNVYRYFIHQKDLLIYTLNIDRKELCSKRPHDTIPISSMQGNYVFIHKDFFTSPPSSLNLNSLKHYITTLSQQKSILINNYEENIVNSSLAAAIQIKKILIISSDGSKSKTVSGGAWIIADMLGQILI